MRVLQAFDRQLKLSLRELVQAVKEEEGIDEEESGERKRGVMEVVKGLASENVGVLLVNDQPVAKSASHDNGNDNQELDISEQAIISVNNNCPLSEDHRHSLVPRLSLLLQESVNKGKVGHDLTLSQQLCVDAAIVMVMKKSKFLAFEDLTKQLLTVLNFVPDVGKLDGWVL